MRVHGDYDIMPECLTLDQGDVFQAIQKMVSMTIAADATDPRDHLATQIPRATPMAPVHSGSDHDDGIWLPIRRTRVDTVATVPTNETIVDNAEPFKVGDVVQAIDVDGPGTAVTNLGAITAIDYDTDTITTTNAADGLNVNDWIEVTENGSVDTDHFIGTAVGESRQVGMLRYSVDLRLSETAAPQVGLAEAVIEGVIYERHVNFSTWPSYDQILIDEFEKLAPLHIHIEQLPHV